MTNYLEKDEIINFYDHSLSLEDRKFIEHKLLVAIREAFKANLIGQYPWDSCWKTTNIEKEIPGLCLEASSLINENFFPCIRIPTKSWGFFEISIEELCVPFENIGHGRIDWAINCLDAQLATLMDEMGDTLDKAQSIKEKWQDLQNKRRREIE